MLNKQSVKTGFSFGLTSGIITTLGLIIGLDSGTHSTCAILAGVLTIAIADALSDALGIHISEETRDGHAHAAVWESTIATFFTKLLISSSFIIPLVLFDLSLAIRISVTWGLFLIIVFNFYLARGQKKKPVRIILEHLLIAIIVIIITHFIGNLAAMLK